MSPFFDEEPFSDNRKSVRHLYSCHILWQEWVDVEGFGMKSKRSGKFALMQVRASSNGVTYDTFLLSRWLNSSGDQ